MTLSMSSSEPDFRCFPQTRGGAKSVDAPETYVEPFTAFRTWKWTTEGVNSLNGELWTPKVAFEAKCLENERKQGMVAAALNDKTRAFWQKQIHPVPDPGCTCGMYAGIDMQHLIEINYISRGIYGEVWLWGRLYRHTLGWRAQYGYPKFFVVPCKLIPYRFEEAQHRLKTLLEFDVDIYLQPEREASVGQKKIPLWIRDYGYSQQGISFLIEKRQKRYSGDPELHTLAKGDRVAVFSNSNGRGGIGVVTEIDGDEIYYRLVDPNIIYHKKAKDVRWNERNWRWETDGAGFMHRLEQQTGR